jgi:hypothetical protein
MTRSLDALVRSVALRKAEPHGLLLGYTTARSPTRFEIPALGIVRSEARIQQRSSLCTPRDRPPRQIIETRSSQDGGTAGRQSLATGPPSGVSHTG